VLPVLRSPAWQPGARTCPSAVSKDDDGKGNDDKDEDEGDKTSVALRPDFNRAASMMGRRGLFARVVSVMNLKRTCCCLPSINPSMATRNHGSSLSVAGHLANLPRQSMSVEAGSLAAMLATNVVAAGVHSSGTFTSNNANAASELEDGC